MEMQVAMTWAVIIGIVIGIGLALILSRRTEERGWDRIEHDLSEAQVRRRLSQFTQN